MKSPIPALLLTLLAFLNVQAWSHEKSSKVITLNTFLLNMDSRDARRVAIIKALNSIEADAVCLQEVFFESDMKMILENTAEKYPHSWSYNHDENGAYVPKRENPVSTCRMRNLFSWGKCLVTKCPIFGSLQDRLDCGLANCNPFDIVEDRCIECVITNCIQYFPDILKVSSCALGSMSSPLCKSWLSTKPEPTRGLLMLSKKPMDNRKKGKFYSVPTFMNRAYLAADIDGLGTVACAHLTSDIKGLPFLDTQLPFVSSYAEMNHYELHTLLNEYKDVPKVLILGDLNTGPEIREKGIWSSYPENFKLLGEMGYVSTNAPSGNCTYCAHNALVGHGPNELIDHIVLHQGNSDAIQTTQVVFKADVVETPGGKIVPLSDHYGIVGVLNHDDESKDD